MGNFSCGANLARVFLVIFNLIFVLVGLGLIVLGGLLKGGAEFLDVLGDFVKQIPGLGSIAIAIIVLGCAIFLIGILGTCGACCSVRCMLVLYAVCVIIITLAEIIIVALLFTGKLDKTVQDGFAKLTNKYKMPTVSHGKVDTTDVISRLIDMVFIELNCCEYEKIKGASISKLPATCCNGITRAALESGTVTKTTCSSTDPSYYDKKCGTALIGLLKDNQSWVIGIGVGILVIELLCIAFSFWICHQINQKNKVSSF